MGRGPSAQGALASWHGHTQLPGPQGRPQQVCGSHGCIRIHPQVVPRAQGSSRSGSQGHGSGTDVKEAAGLAGSQGLLHGWGQLEHLNHSPPPGFANKVVLVWLISQVEPIFFRQPQEPTLTLYTQVLSLRTSLAPGSYQQMKPEPTHCPPY